jgi:hypothetical protein
MLREREGVKADYGVHLGLAMEILRLVMNEDISELPCRSTRGSIPSKKPRAIARLCVQLEHTCGATLTFAEDSRKTLVSFLGKLNLPESEETEAWKIQAVAVLVASIRSVSFGRVASKSGSHTS